MRDFARQNDHILFIRQEIEVFDSFGRATGATAARSGLDVESHREIFNDTDW